MAQKVATQTPMFYNHPGCSSSKKVQPSVGLVKKPVGCFSQFGTCSGGWFSFGFSLTPSKNPHVQKHPFASKKCRLLLGDSLSQATKSSQPPPPQPCPPGSSAWIPRSGAPRAEMARTKPAALHCAWAGATGARGASKNPVHPAGGWLGKKGNRKNTSVWDPSTQTKKHTKQASVRTLGIG